MAATKANTVKDAARLTGARRAVIANRATAVQSPVSSEIAQASSGSVGSESALEMTDIEFPEPFLVCIVDTIPAHNAMYSDYYTHSRERENPDLAAGFRQQQQQALRQVDRGDQRD